MAKKDELLENMNNETEAVSEDKPLEKKAVEELQEELSSVFNEDYDENEEDEEWEEEFPERLPLLPFLGRKERLPDPVEEKKSKKIKLPWGKKAQDAEEKTEEKTENSEISTEEKTDKEIPKEKKSKKPAFSWKKKSEKDDSVKDDEETEIIKKETPTELNSVEEDEEIALEEMVEDTSSATENREAVADEVVPMAEAVEESDDEKAIEEIQPFEAEKIEEVIEEIPPFEKQVKEQENIWEEAPEAPAEKKFKMPVLPWASKKNKVEKSEPQVEKTEISVNETAEEIKPFEENTVEEKQEEIIEELPQFEEEKAEEAIVETTEEIIEEIPPFEATVEEIEELPSYEAVETEKPQETDVISEETAEETKPVKQKKVKEKKAKKEKVQNADAESLTKKDHITFALAIVALVLSVAFVCFKFLPVNNNGGETPENNMEETGAKLSEIQVVRQGVAEKYIQSDAENIFYSFSSDYEVKYFEYESNIMKPLQATGTVNAKVVMEKNNLPVTINYIKTDNGIFGISIFRSEDNPGSTIHNVITFKLVDLPEKHKAEGKALLLAVANSESASGRYNLWTDSFIVDLNTGETTRFLTADKNGNSYSVAYSVLTNSAYVTDGEMIPFFTTREYAEGSGKKDLFVKNGTTESLFATDVYGEYIYADSSVVAYLKATETGFNVVKKENTKEEKIVFSLYGSFSSDYLYHREYLLDKVNGNFYNAKTGEEVALAGYRMSNAEMMSVSPDGRYLIVLGTVNNVADYQVHIFDLKNNDYAKFEDLNFSQHSNLVFTDNTKVMYIVVDPNQGYEHVILDVSKAF